MLCATLRLIVLRCALMRRAVLCCVVLRCAVLRCAVLCCAVLCGSSVAGHSRWPCRSSGDIGRCLRSVCALMFEISAHPLLLPLLRMLLLRM